MRSPDPRRLAVAIVSFNGCEDLRRCLDSVIAAAPAEVVVVDNASSDGSVELVRATYPDVRLIANEINRGYGAAANQAIAASATPATLLLNSDTIIAPDTPTTLGGYLADHPAVAVVGPRLVNADGSLQRSTYAFPSAADMLFGESGLHLLVRSVPLLRERFWRTWSHDQSRAVPWLLGAALAIRRAPFDAVGGFDEGFFMYGEEVDLCRRLAAEGFETHYTPGTTVVHLGGSSTRREAQAMRREYLVSMRRYLRRHEPDRSAAAVLAVLRAAVMARLARDTLHSGLARSADARTGLRAASAGWRALLSEPSLWKP